MSDKKTEGRKDSAEWKVMSDKKTEGRTRRRRATRDARTVMSDAVGGKNEMTFYVLSVTCYVRT